MTIKSLEEIPYTSLFFKAIFLLLFSLYVYFIILMRGSSILNFSEREVEFSSIKKIKKIKKLKKTYTLLAETSILLDT